jgi:hypothetical protein
MPKGVYRRTKQARENIAKGLMGRVPWNKGHINNGLLDEVRQIISNSNVKLSTKQIHETLAVKGILPDDRKGYKRLNWHIVKAIRSGMLDRSLIRNGKGQTQHRRGGASPKFHVGDKVRIIRNNTRTPQWLKNELRLNNCRTITKVVPVKGQDQRSTLYYLGTNKMGNAHLESYGFRCEELELFVKNTVGRPKSKRKYNKILNKGTDKTGLQIISLPKDTPTALSSTLDKS